MNTIPHKCNKCNINCDTCGPEWHWYQSSRLPFERYCSNKIANNVEQAREIQESFKDKPTAGFNGKAQVFAWTFIVYVVLIFTLMQNSLTTSNVQNVN